MAIPLRLPCAGLSSKLVLGMRFGAQSILSARFFASLRLTGGEGVSECCVGVTRPEATYDPRGHHLVGVRSPDLTLLCKASHPLANEYPQEKQADRPEGLSLLQLSETAPL